MMRPDADFTARVGSVTYQGSSFLHKPGWYVEEMEGLNDGAMASPDEEPRDGGDGQHDLPNRLADARSIMLRGFAYADSLGDLGRMSRQQGALLSLSAQSDAFVWSEFGEWFTTHVRRGPNWRFQREGDTGFANFTVRFRAPSQAFYGMTPDVQSGNDVYVENRGTIPSAPVIVVTGNMPNGYAIYGPGERVYQVAYGINPGNRDVIDMSTGLLRRDGILVSGVYGSRVDTWSIPPGRTNQVLVPVSGSGVMSVALHPAFF